MKLENQFTLGLPIEEVWPALLDVERMAKCLPGAVIETGDADGVYRGSLTVKLGPMTVDYQGTARLQDVDEDTHTASLAVQARERKGSGTAGAAITNRLEAENGGTRVTAETDLNITGRAAQLGGAIMEEIARTMIDKFATEFELELQSTRTHPSAPADAHAPADEDRRDTSPQSVASETEALDLGQVIAGTQLSRYAGYLGAALLVFVGIVALIRCRHGASRGMKVKFEFSR